MNMRSDQEARRRLLEILTRRSLRFGRFVLASGDVSDHYVDVRKTSLDAEGVSLVARLLADATGLGTEAGPDAVGGPTLGADPLVTALTLEARSRGRAVDGFLVRKAAKEHGAGNRIEGNLEPGARVLVVDDVLTRGGSLLSAIGAIEEAGAQVLGVGCVVDRRAGGAERLAARGHPLHALFRIDEVLRVARDHSAPRAASA